MSGVRITVNGEAREVPARLTLASLLAHLGLRDDTVVVEHNRRIVRRAELDAQPVGAGDEIEIVHFVGGG